MSERFHDVLVEAADLAPPTQPDPDELWKRARRANRIGRVATAAVVVVLCLLGGLAFKDVVVHDDTQPTDSPGSLGFPDDLYDIPSRAPTTDEAGPLGPLAFVSIGERQGFWPWSSKQKQVYGVSASTGDYRFLSLPGVTQGSGLGDPLLVSPNGTKIAYPYQRSGREETSVDGIAVYDSLTGQVAVYAPESQFGIAVPWMAWSPDSGELLAGWMLGSKPDADGNGQSFDEADIISYLTDTGEFTTVDGTRALSGDFKVSWKAEGGRSPGGLVTSSGRGIVIHDPDSGEVITRYRLSEPSDFQNYMLWTEDGDSFVVNSPDLTIGTLNSASETVQTRVIGTKETPANPMGWMGPSADDPVLALSAVSSASELLLYDKEGITHRPVSGSLSAVTWVAADVLATGKFKDAKEPRRPWGWDMALALVVMGLYLVRFVVGIMAQYAVRPVTATWFDVLKSVWREDGVAVLSLVPALSIAAALVVREQGWVDPISIVAVMLLTWWTMNRSPGGYGLLITWIVGYTAATALWRLDSWQDSTLVVVIGLVQLAGLRAPGTQDLIGRGSPGQTDLGWGSSPYGPGIIHSPGPGDNLTG